MILSNVEIYRALDSKRIILTPEPTPRLNVPGQESPFDTHSVDVRLSSHLSIPQKGGYTFDLDGPGVASSFPSFFLVSPIRK